MSSGTRQSASCQWHDQTWEVPGSHSSCSKDVQLASMWRLHSEARAKQFLAALMRAPDCATGKTNPCLSASHHHWFINYIWRLQSLPPPSLNLVDVRWTEECGHEGPRGFIRFVLCVTILAECGCTVASLLLSGPSLVCRAGEAWRQRDARLNLRNYLRRGLDAAVGVSGASGAVWLKVQANKLRRPFVAGLEVGIIWLRRNDHCRHSLFIKPALPWRGCEMGRRHECVTRAAYPEKWSAGVATFISVEHRQSGDEPGQCCRRT